MSEDRVIYKYAIALPPGATQHAIPEGSFFLSLQVQHGIPVMWWSVPRNEQATKLRTFEVVVTGPPGYIGKLHYVGTFQLGDLGEFVGHVLSHEPIPVAPKDGVSP